MKKAPIPYNDSERIKALEELEVLDTTSDDQFDSITKAVQEICECKIALISLIDSERQWFKSKQGLSVNETSRDISYCGHAIMADEIFIVEDATKDERFCDNPLLLEEPHVRFYAGAPLITSDGYRIGTLCVADSEPKQLTEQQILILKTLSKQTVTYLELRKESILGQDNVRKMQDFKKGLDYSAIIARTDIHGNITYVNDNFCHISKYSREELIGKNHRIINSGYHSKEFFQNLWETINKGENWQGEIRNRTKDGEIYWVDTSIFPLLDKNGDITEFMSYRYDITEKKESDILLDETQRIAKIGGWKFDVVSSELTWTAETYRIHGLDCSSDLDVEKAINFYAEHERERISKMFGDCIAEGKSFSGDFEIISVQGEKIWVHSKGEAEFGQDGKVVRVSGTFQNVTEQKEQEQSVKNFEDKLKLIYEQTNDAVMTIEPPLWKFTGSNPATLNLFKVDTEEQLVQMGPWDVSPEFQPNGKLSADMSKEVIQEAMDTGKSDFEWTHKSSEGDEISCTVLLSRIVDHDRVYLQAVVRDISEQKRMERELKESEKEKLNELKSILSSTPSCLKIINKEGQLIEMNEQGLDLIESADFQSVYKANVYDIVEESHRKKFMNFNAKICNGQRGALVFEIIGLKGTRRWMETYAAPYKLPNGDMGHIAITNDITSKVEAEQEYAQQKAIAEHQSRLASIGELAAGVGHEINNPLAIIKGYVQALERKLAKDNEISKESLTDYLDKVGVATDRVAKIVQGLRTFSRSESTEIAYFSPFAATKESVDLVKEIFQQDNITLTFNNTIKDEDLVIKGNRGRFQQVIMNLFSNARDAVKSNDFDKVIHIELNKTKKCFELIIRDNGCGIEEKLKKKIFEPFFTTKGINEGTGIGLSLVHNFIKEMNAELVLESDLGERTEFTIKFPYKINSLNQDKTDKNAKVGEKTLEGRVILVDDEEGIRDLLTDILENMGLKVASFENGEKAFHYYKENFKDFDLIVSDMQMPVMDGVSLLKAIRACKEIQQPKFVFTTGGVNVNFEDESNELNKLVDGYFLKPFEYEEIYDTLKVCLEKSKRKDAA